MWLLWGEAARQRETGPGVDMTGADRRKGLLSCCITARTTHHVPLEPVTWGTADVASIDQAPACSQAAACSSDWQALVRSSFMHFLLLFTAFYRCRAHLSMVPFLLYFSPTSASLTSFPHTVRFSYFSGETAEFCPEFHLDSIKKMWHFPEVAGNPKCHFYPPTTPK